MIDLKKDNKNISDKDIKLNNNLKHLTFKPSSMWVNNTIDKLNLLDNDNKGNYTNIKGSLFNRFYFFNNIYMSSKKLLFIGGTVLATVSILVLGAFLASRFLLNRIDVNQLTLEQRQEILASVIKNNSTSLLGGNNENNSLATLAGDASAESKLSSSYIYPYFERDYKYRYSKVNYSSGSAVALCKQFNTEARQASVSESYEYFDGNDNYSKYSNFDQDGILMDYYLNKNTLNSSETIEYKGGSYAIRWSYDYSNLKAVDSVEPLMMEDDVTNDLPVSDEPVTVLPPEDIDEPVVEEPSNEDLIAMYFGEDADVVGTSNINGVDYYVIQYSYKTNCNDDMFYPLYDIAVKSEIDLPDTIIVQNVVNPETFEIVNNRNFLGSVNETNLLNQYTSEIITSNQDYAEVSPAFEFEYGVEIRDYTYPTYSYLDEANNLIDYLRNNNLTLLTLNYPLNYASSNIASQNLYASTNYLSDRNFFPEGPRGDEMYNLYNYVDSYTSSYVNFSYLLNSDTYQTLSIDLYDSTVDLNEILGLNGIDNEVVTDTSVLINGVSVNATLYEYTPDFSIYAEDTISSDRIVAPDSNYTVRYIVIDYNNYKYVVFVSDKTIDVTLLDFTTISTSNSSDLEVLRTEIIDAYNGVNLVERSTDGSEGGAM